MFSGTPDQEEQWRPIPDFDGYEVSDQGRVRSYFKSQGKRTNGRWSRLNIPRLLRPGCVRGYLAVNLYKDGAIHSFYVHHLVLLAFVGPREDGLEACHADGSRDNNRLENLRYDTHKNNSADAIAHGRMNGTPKFTDAQAATIRKARALGISTRALARQWSASMGTIQRICRGRSYTDADGPITMRISLPERKKLCLETARQIRREYTAGGITLAELGRRYGVSESAISLVVNGKRWPEPVPAQP